MNVWKRMRPYMRQYWLAMISIVIGSGIVAGSRLIEPYINKVLVDDIWKKISPENMQSVFSQQLPKLLLFMGIAEVGQMIVLALYTFFSLIMIKQLELTINKEAATKMFALDIAFHQSKDSKRVMKEISDGIYGITDVIHDRLSKTLLPQLLNIICAFAVMLHFNWKLALISLAGLPLHCWYTERKATKIIKNQEEVDEIWKQIYSRLHEAIENIKVVIGFGAVDYELNSFQKKALETIKFQFQIGREWRILGVSSSIFKLIGKYGLILLGSYYVGIKNITAGEMIMFTGYAGIIHQPISDIISARVEIAKSTPKIRRFFELIDAKPLVQNQDNALRAPKLKHAIEFRNVSFMYPETNTYVLKNINFTFKRGKKYAFVGMSGAGKTTLAQLITRYYDTTEGIITYDGVDIRHFDLRSLRENIGVVHQNAPIFKDSVLNNIAFGIENPSIEDIVLAAQQAQADDFIKDLSAGYGTIISPKRLSGGQAQRISIARALYRNPEIIILDEPTSSLDSEAESKIKQALNNLLTDRTSFTIAHRLSTIVDSDEILVLEGGEIIAHGTHEQLLTTCQQYANLWKLQTEYTSQPENHESEYPAQQ